MIIENPKVAPIILFVFARPEHTRRTLDSLAANMLAEQSDLFVYADAARNDKERERVNAVRLMVNSLTGFKSVNVIERETNYGLARNIIEGVTAVCNQYGKAIVLEDDIVTSPYFLKFMNESLDLYCDDKNVYSISGCTYPAQLSDVEDETFFMRIPLCWGWATWIDRWEKYEKDLSSIPAISTELIDYINFEGCCNYFNQAKLNLNGKLNTWFIFWYIILAKNNAFTLFPKNSLVENVGHDGTGENCGKSAHFYQSISMRPVCLKKIKILENEIAVEQHRIFFNSLKKSFFKKVSDRLIKMLGYFKWD